MKIYFSSLLYILFFALFLICVTVNYIPYNQVQRRSPYYPTPEIQYLTFGYKEQLADLIWVRAIQDFDYCDIKISQNICRNDSWLFGMLDLITDLSPKFRVAYSSGALALTVIITDVEGATKIFEKGIKELPNDWPIAYRAAYHYLYEVKDKKRAAELLIQAGQNGAPPWVFNLAGRLYSDSGDIELAKKVLEEMRESKQEQGFIKRLEEKIAAMEKEQAAKKTK